MKSKKKKKYRPRCKACKLRAVRLKAIQLREKERTRLFEACQDENLRLKNQIDRANENYKTYLDMRDLFLSERAHFLELFKNRDMKPGVKQAREQEFEYLEHFAKKFADTTGIRMFGSFEDESR